MLSGKVFIPGFLAALFLVSGANAGDLPKPMDSGALAATSAGTAPGPSNGELQTVTATNTGSTITAGQVTNGAVNFTSSAFSGFNGIGNVVVNTGNNNNIQGTMSVTVMASPNP